MKIKKFFIILSCAFIATSVFAQSHQDDVEEAKRNAEETISKICVSVFDGFEQILPETASLMGVQPDAYIGNVFPSVPPHFAIGLNAGVTLIDLNFLAENLGSISSAFDEMNSDAGSSNSSGSSDSGFGEGLPKFIPYPSLSVNGRIGGVILPFDVGIWGVTTGKLLNNISMGEDSKVSFSYTQFGFDARYAVLEGKGLLPKISVGAGYQFVRQKFGYTMLDERYIDYTDDEGHDHTGSATQEMGLNLNIDTHTFIGSIQVSKTLLIFTPYIGLKAMFSSSKPSYSMNYNLYLDGAAIDDLSLNVANTYKHKVKDIGINTQIFGGFSLNLALFQATFNSAYSFRTKRFSASIGTNIKL